jgi:hypothetical protein
MPNSEGRPTRAAPVAVETRNSEHCHAGPSLQNHSETALRLRSGTTRKAGPGPAGPQAASSLPAESAAAAAGRAARARGRPGGVAGPPRLSGGLDSALEGCAGRPPGLSGRWRDGCPGAGEHRGGCASAPASRTAAAGGAGLRAKFEASRPPRRLGARPVGLGPVEQHDSPCRPEYHTAATATDSVSLSRCPLLPPRLAAHAFLPRLGEAPLH